VRRTNRWRRLSITLATITAALTATLMLPQALLAVPPAEAPARQHPVLKAGALPTVVFSIQPDHTVVTVCCTHQSSHLVASVRGLRAFFVQISFDPELLALSDLDAEAEGIQVRLGEAVRALPHSVQVNHIDAEAGTINLRVDLLDSATLNGEVTLATMTWLPLKSGEGSLKFTDAAATIEGPETPAIVTRQGGISVLATCGEVSGTCHLEGRTQHDGTRVINGLGDITWTDAAGRFSIAGTPAITLSHPAYVSTQVDLRGRLSRLAPLANPTYVDLGELSLRAGDLNADSLVNVFDLTYLASHFQSTAAAADINSDGVVDVMDMVLVANNFGIEGPMVVQ
jgi:hypothetical protein